MEDATLLYRRKPEGIIPTAARMKKDMKSEYLECGDEKKSTTGQCAARHQKMWLLMSRPVDN